ncbi:hypothetical protein FA048_06440 [Pedobacter polaris]|uniref:Uncharacterized protein n=1 Tax=Pedobacter polaris TaxID=2571273 RepID=A0A4U1CVH9_9SPHI|nr:hypothetical protein [Pedobacter polaris]TKC13241.1 hypothetical protein FA048_06440 [Pedobacter polaris]
MAPSAGLPSQAQDINFSPAKTKKATTLVVALAPETLYFSKNLFTDLNSIATIWDLPLENIDIDKKLKGY